MSFQLKCPQLPESNGDIQVDSLAVKVGDVVMKDQLLLTLEFKRSKLNFSSDIDGVVDELLVKQGDSLNAEQPILTIRKPDLMEKHTIKQRRMQQADEQTERKQLGNQFGYIAIGIALLLAWLMFGV